MAANWKKIILSGSEANLNEITASNGIQISPAGISTIGADNDNQKVLVIDASSNGNVLGISLDVVGSEGTSLISFVTMSINGTATVSSSATTANDMLFITSSAGNPLTVVGTDDDADDTITITVATASAEIVEDTADALLTGPHENLTINYVDASTTNGEGTFSLTGSATTSFADTTGQTGVDFNESSYANDVLFANILNLPIPTLASASGLRKEDSVQFTNITSSQMPGGGHNGNISQTTDVSTALTSNNFYGIPLISPGEWISASALHITNEATIGNDLTMSGDFVFQGFAFLDQHILTHDSGNLFGSGSMPAALANSHQFTGSIFVTGSDITLQQSNSFFGDGSGLTNLSTGSISLLGILTGSTQIESDISGAFQFTSPTLRTASLTDGTVSAITSSGNGWYGSSGLASGDQIHTLHLATTASFKTFVADNYIISASEAAIAGIDITTFGNVAPDGTITGPISQKIVLDVFELTEVNAYLDSGSSIMFKDISDGNTLRKGFVHTLGFMTGSTAGTVTEIFGGNGINVSNGTGYDGETIVATNIDVVLSGSANGTFSIDGIPGYTTSNLLFETTTNELGLNPKVHIKNILATTGSFNFLKVSNALDVTDLQTETVTIKDNFILVNANLEGDPNEDNEGGGISIARGDSLDSNLFWEETDNRWSLNLANLRGTGGGSGSLSATPDSYLAVTTFNTSTPLVDLNNNGDPTVNPLMPGGTGVGTGNIHINTTAGAQEVWIYA